MQYYIFITFLFPEIIDYFPEYLENPEYLPPKKYMWDIFSTKDSSMANKFISHSLKERNLKDNEGERTVEVSEYVLNQLHSVHFFLRRKEKLYLCYQLQRSLERSRERSQ